MELTIGEKIFLAEEELNGLRKRYDFCIKVAEGEINIKKYYAHLLIPTVYEIYVFDEDEEYYFEIEREKRTISKEDFIEERKEEIRQMARNLYIRSVEAYSDPYGKALNLKSRIFSASKMIKMAKKKHFFSYKKACLMTSRMHRPSFRMSIVGHEMCENIQCGIKGIHTKKLSYIEKLQLELQEERVK